MAQTAYSSTLSDQGGRPSTREKLMMPIPMEACLRLVIRLGELGLQWMLPNKVTWLCSHRWAPRQHYRTSISMRSLRLGVLTHVLLENVEHVYTVSIQRQIPSIPRGSPAKRLTISPRTKFSRTGSSWMCYLLCCRPWAISSTNRITHPQ